MIEAYPMKDIVEKQGTIHMWLVECQFCVKVDDLEQEPRAGTFQKIVGIYHFPILPESQQFLTFPFHHEDNKTHWFIRN